MKKQPKPPAKKCPYCKSNLQFWMHENNNTGMVYQCVDCPVQVIFHYSKDTREPDDKLDKTVYVIDKQGHLYTWTDNHTQQTSYITDINVQIDRPKDRDPILINFPKYMNVNPSIVREKFSFYMVFL